MAIISNSVNMSVSKLQAAEAEIDRLLEQEKARKTKNESGMSAKAKSESGPYKTPLEIKLENAKQVYAGARSKLSGYISELSTQKVPSSDKTYLETFFGGSADGLTLTKIGATLAGKDTSALSAGLKSDLSGGTISYDKAIDIQRTFLDRVKDLGGDFVGGRSKAIGLAKGAVAFGMLSLIARGVTGLLADNLMLPNSMGLLGLAKFGISKLPALGTLLGDGAAAAFGFCPEMMIAFGAAGALVAVPFIIRKIKKAHAKIDSSTHMEKNFAENFAKGD